MQNHLIIDIENNIHDPLAMQQPHLVAGVFREARDALAAGKTVTLQREVPGSPPDVLAVFTELLAFEAWVTNLNRIRLDNGLQAIV